MDGRTAKVTAVTVLEGSDPFAEVQQLTDLYQQMISVN